MRYDPRFPDFMKRAKVELSDLPIPTQNLVQCFSRALRAVEDSVDPETEKLLSILAKTDALICAQIHANFISGEVPLVQDFNLEELRQKARALLQKLKM